jgi:hypothetical protein
MTAKGKGKGKRRQDFLTFLEAAEEIAQGLKVKHEAGAMTLYGLCATGNVRSFNAQEEFFDPDECTIANFEGNPTFVIASGVRHCLVEWSPDALPSQRDAEIDKRLRAGVIPGRNVSWKQFGDDIRDACNGWIVTGGQRKPNRAFGDKQIQRIVKDLKAK